MNVIQMEKGKERWSMIADDIWDMILGKSGRLPGYFSARDSWNWPSPKAFEFVDTDRS